MDPTILLYRPSVLAKHKVPAKETLGLLKIVGSTKAGIVASSQK
jgi:hypothetical protein